MDLSDKDHILANMQAGHQSDWELAKAYFWNMTVVSTIFIVLYIMVHILLCEPSKLQGLEFNGLDLPDSMGELITGGILVLQLERIYSMVHHFVKARLQQGKHIILCHVILPNYLSLKYCHLISHLQIVP